ncbi:hypothetical protein BD560DRAFT_394411 [Blakeslea trispora]|nr:hypothetical protein BD560DRAFT_394411 [Blakeslea trispora]
MKVSKKRLSVRTLFSFISFFSCYLIALKGDSSPMLLSSHKIWTGEARYNSAFDNCYKSKNANKSMLFMIAWIISATARKKKREMKWRFFLSFAHYAINHNKFL